MRAQRLISSQIGCGKISKVDVYVLFYGYDAVGAIQLEHYEPPAVEAVVGHLKLLDIPFQEGTDLHQVAEDLLDGKFISTHGKPVRLRKAYFKKEDFYGFNFITKSSR